ncbi:aldehyde reductase [Actinotalea sp. M2MS4P-6]|uniref:SDR family oxidoreductase n=1 Tax=Actinotalea sp. M2MS4P-6 TaxID=2983762 RepID=UPI0021E3D70F|nr:aldehyde reductase [Actinotalea sp. M2MS4P-6]MCV2395447.1 aldehyde reductase [Actinotalea sp. M2MS4P-6]
MTSQTVLVTGGSGFVAGHVILQLLDAGFTVRTTVRSLAREDAVRRVLGDAGMTRGDRLTFVAADLLDDAGWGAAVAGVDTVVHVASPVVPGHVDDERRVIEPAVDGTVRVLRAARDAGVRRVVLTSAFHAVSWGHPHDGRVFTDDDWSDLDGPGVDAYAKSKTLAERAAWDLVASDGGSMELTTMLPVAVMGPVMGDDISGSNGIVRGMLAGAMPRLPDMYLPIVDVRDVAAAHVAAITVPAAAGQRFLLSNGPVVALGEIGAILRSNLGGDAARVPTRTIPDVVVRLAAVFSPRFRALVPDLGHRKQTSNQKARRILGWEPRPAEEAILAAAESMVSRQLVGR